MTKTPIAVLGIDLGKNSCSLVGLDASGAVVLRRGVRRETIPGITAKLPHCMIAMEACCGAHHLGRLLARQGHTIRLMSPEYVRPYVKAQKNDDRDAEGIAEAATRPTMRFVELKTQDQLDLQTLHRVRSRLVGMRTTLINQLRAILLERGSVFPKGRRKLEVALNAFLADPEVSLAGRIRTLIVEIRAEWASLDARIGTLDRKFVEVARDDEAARRLVTIPGVGPMTATALRAAIDDGSAFTRARDLPAWLGLVPKQHTTGGKPRLLGISRRGNAYLRQLFIHGARAAMPSMSKAENPTGAWLRGCSRAPIPMSWSWRLPPSWRGSRGRRCDAARALLASPRWRRHRSRAELAATAVGLGSTMSAGGSEDGLTVDRRPDILAKKCGSRGRTCL